MKSPESKKAKYTIGLVLILAALFLFLKTCVPQYQQSVDLESRLDTIIGSPHGIGFSPDSESKIKDIRENFTKYRPLLEIELAIPRDLRQLSNSERRRRYESTIILLRAVGTSDAVEMIVSAAHTHLDYLEKEWITIRKYENGELRSVPPAAQTSSILFNLSISSLAKLKNTSFVDSSFALLDEASISTTENLLRYLVACSTVDDTIRPRLRGLLNDEDSRINADPIMRDIAMGAFEGPQ